MLSVFCLGLLAGCGPTASLTVSQPEAPAPMNELELRSRWAHFETDGRERYLASFPFPGAVAGDRQFVLYFICEAGARDILFRQHPGGGRRSGGVGFFVQERGDYAGLTRVVDGAVRVRGVPFGGKKRRRVELTLHCDDGTTISGRLVVVRSRLELAAFEQGPHAADAAALRAEASAAPAADARSP